MQIKLMNAILLGLLSGNMASGQHTVAVYRGSPGCDLNCKLGQIAEKYTATFNSQRLEAAFFVYFRVDSAGNTCDIHYQPGTPRYIADFIMDGLRATNGSWEPATASGKPVKSKPFLLPVLCELLMPPKGAGPAEDATIGSFEASILWIGHMAEPPLTDTTMARVYGSGTTDMPMECVVLAPLQLFSMKMQ